MVRLTNPIYEASMLVRAYIIPLGYQLYQQAV
jgi:hypothetical protein